MGLYTSALGFGADDLSIIVGNDRADVTHLLEIYIIHLGYNCNKLFLNFSFLHYPNSFVCIAPLIQLQS